MLLSHSFNRNGYVVVRNMFPDLSRFTSEWQEDREYISSIASGDPHRYINMVSSISRSSTISRMFLSNEVGSVLRAIGIDFGMSLFYPPVMHVMAEDFRLPIEGAYYGTPSHQDWHSMQGSLNAVTVWASASDTTNNFPLEVIPGSHLDGLKEGRINGSVLEVDADGDKFIPVNCEAGDVVFMSAFLVHRTGKGGDGLRIAFSSRFEDATEPTFAERDFPCAQKRTVRRDMITPGFPTIEQVREVYNAVD